MQGIQLPRIIPVIDLMGGVVVRGVAGRRHEYQPIVSQICADATPDSVGRAFIERLGLFEVYVADLDAIGGAEPAWEVYSLLMQLGLRLWVDAGVEDVESARALARFVHRGCPLEGVVAGLESIKSEAVLAEMVAAVGPERLIFSLDLKGGVPLSTAGWQGCDALAIATAARNRGVRRMIVLDLARVGVAQGVGTETLCRQLRSLDADLEIHAGGGVRGVDDLRALAAAGCQGALVASALHDQRITARDL